MSVNRDNSIYIGRKTNTGALTANVWKHVVITYNGSGTNAGVKIYVNGVQADTTDFSAGTYTKMPQTSQPFQIGARDGSLGVLGVLDEVLVFNYSLSSTDVSDLYNSGTGKFYPLDTPAVAMNDVTFISQVPSDINATILFSTPLVNFTYQYRNQSLNLTNLKLNYTISGSMSCIQNINGTCIVSNTTYQTATLVYATSPVNNTLNVTYQLGENSIYPYLINLNGSIFMNNVHSVQTLTVTDLIKSSLKGFNTSINTFNIFEVMSNVTSGGLSRVYICNSTYTTGTVSTDPNCQEIGQINKTTYNHTHNENSSHNIVDFSIIGGRINGNGIYASSTMYFVIRRVSGAGYVYYVPNVTDTTVTQFSNNNGVTYSNVVGTIDMHVHNYPFTNDLTLNYKGEGLFNGSTIINSSIRGELIELTPFPPTAPQVTNPFSTAQATRYLNITYTASTQNLSFANMSYYKIELLNSTLGTIKTITANNSLNLYYNWDVYAQNLSIGQYYIQVCGYDTLGQFSCDQEYFNLTRNGLVNVTAINYTGQLITGFNISATNLNTSEVYTNSTNTSQILQDIIINNTYTYIFDNSSFAYTYGNNTPTSYLTSYQVVMLPSNSVNITIRDENTNALITQNVTVRFEKVGSAVSYTYVTNTGDVFPAGLESGNYTVTFTSTTPSAYNVRFYNLEIVERQSTTLNAFLNNGGVVLLNYKNQAGQPLPFVDVVVSRVINGSFVTVESLTTQIDGRTEFNYLPSTRYRIVSTLADYNNLTFELNPVLFTSYDVTMTRSGTNIVEPTAFASWSPTTFVKDMNTQLTFEITSPYGSLINYTVVMAKNGVPFYLTNGYYSTGELIYIPFNTTNAVSGDYLTVYYSYFLNNNASQSFTFNYPIVVPITNRTLKNMGTDFYGFGIGDRILIVVFLNILAFGVGFLVSGTSFGSILMMGNSLIFMTSGFVPAPVFYVSIVLGILIIMGRGVNDG